MLAQSFSRSSRVKPNRSRTSSSEWRRSLVVSNRASPAVYAAVSGRSVSVAVATCKRPALLALVG